jgi:hypothetical protein
MFSVALQNRRKEENQGFPYRFALKNDIKISEVSGLMKEVASIQESIEWISADFDLANHSFTNTNVHKLLAKDVDTRELVGYALVNPETDNSWVVSQVAVMKPLQKLNIGTQIFRKIVSKATKRGITTIRLMTNNLALDFFKKLSIIGYECKTIALREAITMVTFKKKEYSKNSMIEFIEKFNAKFPENENQYHQLKHLLYEAFPNSNEICPQDFETLYVSLKHRSNYQKILEEICDYLLNDNVRKNNFIEFYNNTKDQKIKLDFGKAIVVFEYLRSLKDLNFSKIESISDRIEILAKFIVHSSSAYVFFEEFNDFGITDQKGILSLARLAAEKNPQITGIYIDKLGINDVNSFYSIIDLSFKNYLNSKELLYLLNDETDKIEVIEEVAKRDGMAAAIWCKFFHIECQKTLVRIARLALQNKSYWTSHYFDRFMIKDENERVDLFKFAVERKSGVYACIDKFNIQNEKTRIELAKWLIQQGHQISAKIEDFRISNPKDRMEIALLSAEQVGSNFPLHVKLYHIESEERIKLAMICSTHSPEILCNNLDNFQIINEASRINLAHISMGFFSENTDIGNYIKKFDISDEQVRIKFAKRAAEKGLLKSWNHLYNYKIHDSEALYEIALLAALSAPKILASTFYKYRIEDEAKRIFIAKIIARQNGETISKHIHEFCIKDQVALEEIALLAAVNDAKNTAMFIKNYALKNEEARIRVALAIGPDVCTFFSKFDISNKEALLKIAFLIASSPRILVRKLLDQFTFYGELRYKIGKICAHRDGLDTIYNIDSFKFENPNEILEIILMSICNSVKVIDKLPYCRHLHSIAILFWELNTDKKFEKGWAELKTLCVEHMGSVDLCKFVEAEQNPKEKKNLLNWVVFTVATCMHNELTTQDVIRTMNGPIIKAILNFEDIQMRYKLTYLVLGLVKSGQDLIFLNDYYTDIPIHTLIPSLIVFSDVCQGVDQSDYKTIFNRLKNRYYRKPRNQNTLVQGLYGILYDYSFPKKVSHELLRHIFQLDNPSESLKSIMIVETIVRLDGAAEITNDITLEKAIELNSILNKVFMKIIPVESIPDFFDKYQKTFGKFQDPNMLFIYAGKMNTLEDKRPLKALAKFVEMVLNDTFSEDRYKGSLHLDTVFKERNATLQEWKKGLQRPLDIEEKVNNEVVSISFYDELRQTIIVHKHVDPTLCPILISCFSKSPYESTEHLIIIGNALKKNLKDSEESNWLLFQKYSIRLMQPKLTKKEQKTEIAQMKKHLNLCKSGASELLNDLKGWENLYEIDNLNTEGWTLEDCDDPESLISCGTTVDGSCQRVDGDPEFNKHLLGYILDGKNRLLAVKNKHGVVVARSIFCILWDKSKQTPVLFMEKIYPKVVNKRLENEIIQLGRDRAQQLGLILTMDSFSLQTPYNGVLSSLSCKAPYEYADAGDHHQTNGVYTITNAKLVV